MSFLARRFRQYLDTCQLSVAMPGQSLLAKTSLFDDEGNCAWNRSTVNEIIGVARDLRKFTFSDLELGVRMKEVFEDSSTLLWIVSMVGSGGLPRGLDDIYTTDVDYTLCIDTLCAYIISAIVSGNVDCSLTVMDASTRSGALPPHWAIRVLGRVEEVATGLDDFDQKRVQMLAISIKNFLGC